MPISKDQARALAREFLEASHDLGVFRFNNWGTLSATQRRQIEDAEWTLLNYSSDLVTSAVGLALVDIQADLDAISKAVAKGKKAIARIDGVKQVLQVVAALVVLGGAIVSKN